MLGLFYDLPETRVGDVPSVGRPYITTAPPSTRRRRQATGLPGLPEQWGAHIVAFVGEHESAKTPAATAEAHCSGTADKLDASCRCGNTNFKVTSSSGVDRHHGRGSVDCRLRPESGLRRPRKRFRLRRGERDFFASFGKGSASTLPVDPS